MDGEPFEWWFTTIDEDGPGFKALIDSVPGNGLEEVLKKSGQGGSPALSSNTQIAQPPTPAQDPIDSPPSGSTV